MNEKTITKLLTDYTTENSNFETSRDYISLSHCHLSIEELVNQYKSGFQDGIQTRLKCYKGYQMERDLLIRIIDVFGKDRIKLDQEISAFNGKVKGHPDFWFMNYPADCKSVLMDDWLPNGWLPRKVYWQMQGYMYYSNRNKALVIYETRQSGLIKSFWINANRSIQNEIDLKLNEVIKIIGQ
jgi:hypothetical protein